MEENDISLIGGYTRPFWFPFASVYVPVTPCVLDGSLSFLEMVWKLLKDLNKVVEAANANHTDILTIVNEINTIYGMIEAKLSYLEVTFEDNDGTITANKSLDEIVEGYGSGIVIGRLTVNEKDKFYIALGYDDMENRKHVSFYSLDGLYLDEINVYPGTIARHTYTLITSAGGTFTGPISVPAPTEDGHAATKKYVDDQDAATLQSANSYAANQASAAEAAAKNYADTYFVTKTGDSGSTYAKRQSTERYFTNIPAYPETLTLDGLMQKLGRWYEEINIKISNVIITETSGVYSADKTFVDVHQLVSEHFEVRCIMQGRNVATPNNILRVEEYGTNKIIFANSGYQLTWNSDDTISVITL